MVFAQRFTLNRTDVTKGAWSSGCNASAMDGCGASSKDSDCIKNVNVVTPNEVDPQHETENQTQNVGKIGEKQP